MYIYLCWHARARTHAARVDRTQPDPGLRFCNGACRACSLAKLLTLRFRLQVKGDSRGTAGRRARAAAARLRTGVRHLQHRQASTAATRPVERSRILVCRDTRDRKLGAGIYRYIPVYFHTGIYRKYIPLSHSF